VLDQQPGNYPDLKLLKQSGVPILVGSDRFRRSSLGEVLELRAI
jgi:hypothetical protein